ncbi:MAG: sigma-70 family RNA polymerase sigma factor, partial [Oscillospiraceae bacterium]|nr:sigma-70 family RNA polymerase sigma factor [Candidatus Equicaccousia limihippi]
QVHYISSGEDLPPPLSPEKEQELFDRLEQEPEKVRSLLVVHNLRLVVYIAKKFDQKGVGIEDLTSIGTIGLIKAVNTFCPQKNIKLATYASRCIENEILMYLRKVSSRKNEVSLDEPLSIDYDGNELLLGDVLGSEPDLAYKELEESEEMREIKKMVAKLPPREREIMAMRFGLFGHTAKTQKEIAEQLNISQSYISRLEKRIISKLKKSLEALI